MKSIFKSVGILIGLAIVMLVVVMIIAGRDIDPPDTSDLIVIRPEVLPEDNAFTYFDLATNTLYWPTNSELVVDYLRGKPVDETEVRGVIARNATTFNEIQRGLEREVCLPPELAGFDTPLPYISAWLKMGRLLALKVRYERIEGTYSVATDTCLRLLRFGETLQQYPVCIIGYLVGDVVVNLGLVQAEDLAREIGTSGEELARLSDALGSLGPLDPSLTRSLMAEYRLVAIIIDDLSAGDADWREIVSLEEGDSETRSSGRRIPKYLFQPNKTEAIFAEFYRGVISKAPLNYADMNLYEVEDVVELGRGGLVKLMFCPNAVGRVLRDLLVPAVESLLERKCRTECAVSATRLLFACNAYERENGSLPTTLNDLVPTYIEAVPVDSYDGKPFRYSQERAIVYSVGKDRIDSGGSTQVPAIHKRERQRENRWFAEDAVFEITAQVAESDGE